MRLTKWFRRAAGMSLVCASVLTISPLSGPVSPVASAVSADPGGEFHALTPTRILDTRPATKINDVKPFGSKKLVRDPRVDKTAEFDFNVLGKGGLPTKASDVLAIVANVTVTEPGQGGWLAVYPDGFQFGGSDGKGTLSSLINFTAGSSVPNMVIVGVGDTGAITLNGFSNPGSRYHVIIDILGFISTSQYATEAGARLEVVTPGRVLDTRKSSPIGPGQTRELQLRGANTIGAPLVKGIVPNRPTVTAALVNLTLVNNRPDSQNTHVTATPKKIPAGAGATTPSSSNALKGMIKANMTVVPIDADGKIRLYNNSGKLDLVVDVLGYFEEGIHTDGNRGRIVPLDAPFRAFDTREPAFGDAQLQHGTEEEWSFDNFVNSVVLNPGAANQDQGPPQQGLIGSLTAIELAPLYTSHSGPGYTSFLKVTPADAKPAEVSNVNFGLGDIVPNMSLIKYGKTYKDAAKKVVKDPHVIKVYNHYGQIDYLLDVYAIVLDD